MQHQKKKAGKADKANNEFNRTQEDNRQSGNELFVDASQRLDEEDVKENDITGAEADTPEWENEDEDNSSRQGVDKAPGEERGKGDKVTDKNLKGKQVDADPSKDEGKPLKP
jgi:hypothetical protein